MAVIEIPDDQAAVLKARAAAQGLSLEGWFQKLAETAGGAMSALDWSHCPVVESVSGRLGGWVFKDTRLPVSTVFDNLEDGATIDEIMQWFHLTREQIVTVLEFAARSLDPPRLPFLIARMLILFDHSVPAPLRDHLRKHTVVEAIERGWNRLSNGDLLTGRKTPVSTFC